ncbi:MAG: glycosyltransferase family 2 protein [Oscillospiraceae bacterium]|nr:glycosyltransferase family 2 protein [Oscillospiraceae bacterium]
MKQAIKNIMTKNKFTRAVYKTLLVIRYHGIIAVFKIIKRKLIKEVKVEAAAYTYTAPTKAELDKQRKAKFKKDIEFSILTPLYNTNEKFLTEMIESVRAQSYKNWELCLADGSDAEHKNVEAICMSYVKKDSRIKYTRLEQNIGIAENTNACLEFATGDYISFLDHDDLLTPDALYETMLAVCEHGAQFIYSDEDKVCEKTITFSEHCYKPDFAPDYLRSMNYICHFVSVSREIINKIGLLSSGFNGAQDYDFVLRSTEQTKNIYHIPKVLYHWRTHAASTSVSFDAKTYAIESGKKAVEKHLERISLGGAVEALQIPGTYKINYELSEKPLVSILVPNKDHINDLKRCINSVLEKSAYKNFEIVIIENNSTEKRTFEYYKTLETKENIRVVNYDDVFNYSKINNFGVSHANGEYLIFLNNDTEVITESWIEELLMYAQRDDVGIAGAKLYYADFSVQHAGLVVGLFNAASHVHYKIYNNNDPGYSCRLKTAQNYSAVTAACMMMKKALFLDVGGFYEDMTVAYNDIDLCMKVRAKGKLIVWTPFCELIHYECTSRGINDTPEKEKRENNERAMFVKRWEDYWENGDPYYNVNFSSKNADFVIE